MPDDLVIFGVSFAAILGALFALGLIVAICIGVLFSIIMLFFSTFALMIGAKMVDLKGRTFGKALTATFLIIFIGGFVTAICCILVPDLGVIPYFLSPCLFIKWTYHCTYGKAVLASIYSFLISFLMAGFLILTITIATILFFKDKFNKQNEKASKMEIKETKSEKNLKTELKINALHNTNDNKAELTEEVKITPPLVFTSEKTITDKASDSNINRKSGPVAPPKKQKKKAINSNIINHYKLLLQRSRYRGRFIFLCFKSLC
jgi:hypothetical protein